MIRLFSQRVAIEEKGGFKEVKHPNLIFTVIRDAEIAMTDIVEQMSEGPPAELSPFGEYCLKTSSGNSVRRR